MFSGMYVRPLSVKCPYLKNYGALRPMYKKPLFTDKGFAKCIRPLSKKSMRISENSVKRVN